MTTKQILSVLGVLVVLAVIFGVWSSFTTPAAPSEPMAGDVSPILKGRAETDQNYHYKETAPGYEIEAVYPIKVPLPTAEASSKAALTIENKLAEGIAAFKADAAQMLTAEEIARLQSQGRFYALSMDYKFYQKGNNGNIVSYEFDVYQDTGGAHPNAYFKTFVFDEDGSELKLGSLFDLGSTNYLERISKAATAQVTARLQAGMEQQDVTDAIFKEGLEPREENFQNFVIDGSDLVVLIPPYQVASWAAGSFEVRIPTDNLLFE